MGMLSPVPQPTQDKTLSEAPQKAHADSQGSASRVIRVASFNNLNLDPACPQIVTPAQDPLKSRPHASGANVSLAPGERPPGTTTLPLRRTHVRRPTTLWQGSTLVPYKVSSDDSANSLAQHSYGPRIRPPIADPSYDLDLCIGMYQELI
ncbi:hypothetical protein EJ05DRAFT_121961 [Pseudovirgaria hyperparasitica]|uniref:Uncharacterized protein n=1 Tax=Pseudovirgaria hyperparasitica TaxID=470096 RepID=A0A6A6VY20_9PEZI|nr:uncharacterized protein EJ05DRAFT_121961 [Pseudovirgaria hyperparasitica]KAF2755085.1 hypothetical protein EJ05DRAFT_121961 [Pseudovirgaria hyperparasitica]